METETLAMAQEIDFSCSRFSPAPPHRQDGDDHADRHVVLVLGDHHPEASSPSRARARPRSSTAPSGRASRWTSCSKDRAGARGRVREDLRAGMLEWRRSHRQDGGLIAGAQARIDRRWTWPSPRRRGLNKGLSLPGHRRVDRALHRAVRHGLGHQARLRADRDQPEHQPCRRGPRHRRGAAGDRLGLLAAIPAVVFYNKLNRRQRADRRRLRGLCRRIRHDPVAPAGRLSDGAGVIKGGGGGGRRGRPRRGARRDVGDQRHALSST
jgi:biopolymer transport protein TolQ